ASPSEYATATRSSAAWEASNAWPISGSATLATARFRLATAATRINEIKTSAGRCGAARSGAPGDRVLRTCAIRPSYARPPADASPTAGDVPAWPYPVRWMHRDHRRVSDRGRPDAGARGRVADPRDPAADTGDRRAAAGRVRGRRADRRHPPGPAAGRRLRAAGRPRGGGDPLRRRVGTGPAPPGRPSPPGGAAAAGIRNGPHLPVGHAGGD